MLGCVRMIFNYALIEKRIAFVKEEIIGLVKVVYSYLVYVVLLYSVKWSKKYTEQETE